MADFVDTTDAHEFVEIHKDNDVDFIETYRVGVPGRNGSRGPAGSGPDLVLIRSLADFLLQTVVVPDSTIYSHTFTNETINGFTSPNTLLPLTVPTHITFAARMNVSAGSTTVVVEFLNGANTLVDYTYKSQAVSNGFVTMTHSAPVPDTTTSIKVRFESTGTVSVDNLKVVPGQTMSGEAQPYLTEYIDKQNVRPYKSNLAAVALFDAFRFTGDNRYSVAGFYQLSWYRDHINPVTGYVFDYNLINGELVSTNDMDSTDSYAATYLLALKAAYLSTYSRASIQPYADSLDLVLTAIESTLHNGLTWTKPAFKVKYLMDQVETIAGLRAGAFLCDVLGLNDLAISFTNTANIISTGVETHMWDADDEAYVWAIHENGERVHTHWATKLDAMQNAWAVGFGIINGSRAVKLMNKVDEHQPTWDKSTSIYYAVPIWAYDRVGNSERADESLLRVVAASDSTNRGWPFDALAASTLLLAASKSGMDTYGASRPVFESEVGEQGEPGITPPGFYSGNGAPDENTFANVANGSLYMDLSTGQVYKKDVS